MTNTTIQGTATISNPQLWERIKTAHGAANIVPMLPWDGVVGKETRRLYFDLAVVDGQMNHAPVIAGDVKKLPVNRLISYGDCNVACPYCKRDCQFIDEKGNVLSAGDITTDDLLRLCLWALERGETPRFSGGDPVSFKKETLAVAEYIWLEHGKKISIAHNGSWGKSINRLVPYLSSAAVDLKAIPAKMGWVMGVKQAAGSSLYEQSLKTQREISHAGVLLDVRTPIFGDTTVEEMDFLAADICRSNDLRYTFWTWRMYKEVEGCDWEIPQLDRVQKMMLVISAKYPELWIGMRAKWQAGGMIYIKEGRMIDLSDGNDVELTGSGNRSLKV